MIGCGVSGEESLVATLNEDRCVLDYFPTFRRRQLRRPHPTEMLTVKRILEGAGLRAVVVQTETGHFGPDVRV